MPGSGAHPAPNLEQRKRGCRWAIYGIVLTANIGAAPCWPWSEHLGWTPFLLIALIIVNVVIPLVRFIVPGERRAPTRRRTKVRFRMLGGPRNSL